MTAITFDTLKLTKRLEESGLDRKQAEAQAEALSEAMQSGVEDRATKILYGGVTAIPGRDSRRDGTTVGETVFSAFSDAASCSRST